MNTRDKSFTIADEAKHRIDRQCEKGLSKYGHLLDSAGCDERELIDHALEEVADLFQYLIALRRKIDRNTKVTPPYKPKDIVISSCSQVANPCVISAIFTEEDEEYACGDVMVVDAEGEEFFHSFSEITPDVGFYTNYKEEGNGY